MPWIDPVVDRRGHDPRSTYVEQFWLGTLGPSGVVPRPLGLVIHDTNDDDDDASVRAPTQLDMLVTDGSAAKATSGRTRVATPPASVRTCGLTPLEDQAEPVVPVSARPYRQGCPVSARATQPAPFPIGGSVGAVSEALPLTCGREARTPSSGRESHAWAGGRRGGRGMISSRCTSLSVRIQRARRRR
jgi:hypothetical protein